MTTARDRPPEEASEDTSFARGLRILLTVADRGVVRADELSALLDTPLSTVYRYLRTLADFGFVDRRGSEYSLGPRLVIGAPTVTSAMLAQAALPVLRALVEETGESVVLLRRIGLTAVTLEASEPDKPLRVTLQPGSVLPLHAAAGPRVLLAYAPPEVLDATLDALRDGPQPPGAAAADDVELRAALEEIRESGIARSADDQIPGTVSVAVPVLGVDGIVAAIVVIGPEFRCGIAWRARVARLLPEAGRSVAAAIAGQT